MFSRRTAWEFLPNRLTEAVAERRRKGIAIRDWTASNPTTVGLPYPGEKILGALSASANLRYEPDPRGMRGAREAIARFSRSGAPIDPDAILLTSGSSESYSHLFRLLCEAGDEILIPTPGYPLFEDLARLHDVRAIPYRLRYDGEWHLDRESLRRGLGLRTRAIVIIHPGNPTGNYCSEAEQEFIAGLAREGGIPIISDEVFWSFPLEPEPPAPSLLALDAPLVAVLGGLSKLAGLPQLKLGWVAVRGRKELAAEALQRLEMMGDTFLSVNTPVQTALPVILECAEEFGAAMRSRLVRNRQIIRDGCAGSPVSLLTSQGGWNAILRLPEQWGDEEWALELLERHGILTYPGHFFDLSGGAYLVVSLILSEMETAECVEIVRKQVEARS